MDESLKIRLVGALVLLALLAIAWPFVFDSADEIQLSKESQIPQPPTVQEWQAEKREPPSEDQLGWESASGGSNDAQQPAETTASEGPSASESSSGSAADSRSPVLREAWSVRVATLADLDNGSKLLAQLIKDDFRAYSRLVSTDEGRVMRIYVGPKFDKRRADSIKLNIDKRYSVKSLVVRYTPEET